MINVSVPPLREMINGVIPKSWSRWFESVYRALEKTLPSVSSDNGDASVTLVSGSAKTQRWNTTLTAARTVTLPTAEIFDGMKFRIVREASAGGAHDLDVGGLKTFSGASEWADVEYDGSAWRLTAYGAL